MAERTLIDDTLKKKYVVIAHVPVWAASRDDAREKVLAHTSRSRGIRRPRVLRVREAREGEFSERGEQA